MISSLNSCLLHYTFSSATLKTFCKPNVCGQTDSLRRKVQAIWSLEGQRSCTDLCQLSLDQQEPHTITQFFTLPSTSSYILGVTSLSHYFSFLQKYSSAEDSNGRRAASSLLKLWTIIAGRGGDQTPRCCLTQNNTYRGKRAYSDNSSKADYMHCDASWSPFSLVFYCSYLNSTSFQSFLKHKKQPQ